MKQDKDVTITVEEFDHLTKAIKDAIPNEIKSLVYGREIPVDMKLPNGMNFEEFKQKMQKDMEKDFEFIKSACGMHFPLTENDEKSIDYLQNRMKTALSSEVSLKELFWDMYQKAVVNKKQEAGQTVDKDCVLIRPSSLKNILKIFEKLVVRSKAYMEKNNQKWFDTKIILRVYVGDELELSLLAPITTPTECLLYPFYIAKDDVVYVSAKTSYRPLQLDTLIESDSVRLNYAVKKFNQAHRFRKYYLLKIPKTVAEAKKNIICLLEDTVEETLDMILLKGDEYNGKHQRAL